MNIFQFDDYRKFLRGYISSRPKGGRGEINKIAQYLGIHSSFISQILGGSKEFNLEQAHDLCSYLGLNDSEGEYFLLLVQKSRSGNQRLRQYFEKKINLSKEEALQVGKQIPHDQILTDVDRTKFYSSWLHMAIWLFTSVGKGQTLEDIMARFEIDRRKAQEIVLFLVKCGLCKKENDLYKMGSQLVHVDRSSVFASKHHVNWRLKAMQRSEDIESKELMFTAPISISRDDFAKLRENLMEFIKAASARVSKSNAQDIACINLDLFWVRK